MFSGRSTIRRSFVGGIEEVDGRALKVDGQKARESAVEQTATINGPMVFSREATAADSRGRQPTEHDQTEIDEPQSGVSKTTILSRQLVIAAAASRLIHTIANPTGG